MSFSKKKDPFDIVEHRVNENNQEFFDDLRMDEEEDAIEKMRERERMEEPPKEKANKYGWAFFLASMFIGIGITATIGAPLPLFVGMGVGFLFFVDPIYERFMQLFFGNR
jgi:hypothetical protein